MQIIIPKQKSGDFLHEPITVNASPSTLVSPLQEVVEDLIKNPKKQIEKLEALRLQIGNSPELYNFLIYAYLSKRKIRKSEKLIQEAYQNYPDHLITQINFADQCLRKKQPSKIPQIFNNMFDLTLAHPNKFFFSMAEFRGFMNVMGFYHLCIKEKEKAICYHYLAHCVDPTNSGTQRLGRALYKRKSLIEKFLCYISNILNQKVNKN